jgi:hypothetical protein
MSYQRKSARAYQPPRLQSAIITQALPVQNTWYTVLDTTPNLELISIQVIVYDTGETIEVEATIDGVVKTASQAEGANSPFAYYTWNVGAVATGLNTAENGMICFGGYRSVQCQSAKIRVRKTTAAGTGNLCCHVAYGKY